MGVIHRRNFRAINFVGFFNKRSEVRRGYEIYIRRARLFQFRKDFCLLFGRYFFARLRTRQSVVLTEYAFKRAAAKKHRARSVFAGDARLLELVQIVFCYTHFIFFAAIPGGFFSVRAATDGAERAIIFHENILS